MNAVREFMKFARGHAKKMNQCCAFVDVVLI